MPKIIIRADAPGDEAALITLSERCSPTTSRVATTPPSSSSASAGPSETPKPSKLLSRRFRRHRR